MLVSGGQVGLAVPGVDVCVQAASRAQCREQMVQDGLLPLGKSGRRWLPPTPPGGGAVPVSTAHPREVEPSHAPVEGAAYRSAALALELVEERDHPTLMDADLVGQPMGDAGLTTVDATGRDRRGVYLASERRPRRAQLRQEEPHPGRDAEWRHPSRLRIDQRFSSE